MFHKTLVAAALIGVGLAAGSAQALPAGPLDFTVLRDGSTVGTHHIDIRKSGDETRVDVATEVAVKLAFITLYRFEHQGHEVWKDGRLVRIDSRTNDDGTDKSLHGALNGKGLEIEGSARKYVAEPTILPASLWNPDIVRQGRLLNTLDGRQMRVSVKAAGEETVDVRGKQIPARHYLLTGELERELWFDREGTLVRVRFKGSDNSDILYVLK
jgi:Domain of unknown function (DUF6134)